MKKSLILVVLIAFISIHQTFAQNTPQEKHSSHITKVVSNLTPSQKKKLERIANESKAHKEALKTEQNRLRDSIGYYMTLKEDYTEVVYRLIDQEAKVQAQIYKEMYRSKVLSDRVLTNEQFKELTVHRSKHKEHHKQTKQR